MADKKIGIGNDNGGGPNSTGGPMGGPGRPGKRLVAAQQDSGNYTGPGVPHDPMRGVSEQPKGSMVRKTNPSNSVMDEGQGD